MIGPFEEPEWVVERNYNFSKSSLVCKLQAVRRCNSVRKAHVFDLDHFMIQLHFVDWLCRRQVEEIMEETKDLQNDDMKSDQYASIEENTGEDADNVLLRSIQERVVEDVSESIPAPGEPYFTVTLTDQEITPDNELTNVM